eukprot:scaffold609_cov170-Amphora_coffeaeformis.AAC.49
MRTVILTRRVFALSLFDTPTAALSIVYQVLHLSCNKEPRSRTKPTPFQETSFEATLNESHTDKN